MKTAELSELLTGRTLRFVKADGSKRQDRPVAAYFYDVETRELVLIEVDMNALLVSAHTVLV